VALSKIAAAARPGSCRTEPAGGWDAGGETAAWAGSIVGGALASGFAEQPVIKASKDSRTARRR
jgi:hypothetical protein